MRNFGHFRSNFLFEFRQCRTQCGHSEVCRNRKPYIERNQFLINIRIMVHHSATSCIDTETVRHVRRIQMIRIGIIRGPAGWERWRWKARSRCSPWASICDRDTNNCCHQMGATRIKICEFSVVTLNAVWWVPRACWPRSWSRTRLRICCQSNGNRSLWLYYPQTETT